MKTVEQRISEGIALAERAGADRQQLARALVLFQDAAAQHLDETLLALPELDRFDAAFLRGGDIGWLARANLALKYLLINTYQREALLTMDQALRPLLRGEPYAGTAFHARRYGQFVAALCRPRQFRADDISPLVPEEALLPPRGGDRWRRWRAAARRRPIRLLGLPALAVALTAASVVALLAMQALSAPGESTFTVLNGRQRAHLPTAALAHTATPKRAPAAMPTAAPLPTAAPSPVPPAYTPGGRAIVAGAAEPLDALDAPEPGAERVFSVRNGDIIEVVDGAPVGGPGGPWLEVRISGLAGWLPAGRLRPLQGEGAGP